VASGSDPHVSHSVRELGRTVHLDGGFFPYCPGCHVRWVYPNNESGAKLAGRRYFLKRGEVYQAVSTQVRGRYWPGKDVDRSRVACRAWLDLSPLTGVEDVSEEGRPPESASHAATRSYLSAVFGPTPVRHSPQRVLTWLAAKWSRQRALLFSS